ncbi:MAG TPA: flagellar motor stator protein MotA [Thermodesulfobacteriota bacterium]|nr:flagellar motor stator protein MotA [Thermodesulfobacteriota bacterium]
MLAMAGMGVVVIAVLGGYLIEGGSILVLMQVAEFMIIGGAAAGALLISAPPKLLKKILNRVLSSFKGIKLGKERYLQLLKMMFELFQIGQKEGVLALESHIEHPDKSSIFSKYPEFLKDNYLRSFLTDTVRLVLIGGITPHEIEGLMDTDIETNHQQGTKPGMILQKIGDSMPGLGIVAAVLGIVITMQAIGGPAEEVGRKVAAALVGTFLGVLISYGFIQPLATNLDLTHEEEARMLEVVKAGLTAFAKGFNPMVAVEFGRRSIFDDHRPTFQEMEEALKGKKAE